MCSTKEGTAMQEQGGFYEERFTGRVAAINWTDNQPATIVFQFEIRIDWKPQKPQFP